MTHLHFDHAGNIDAFPNATIYLQQREYDGWSRALRTLTDQDSGKQNWIMSSMSPDDLPRFERAMAAGRVTFIDGMHEVAPGLSLHLAEDTHTFGSQWVKIDAPDGPFVLAGDCVVTYANLERRWPPGYHQGNAWRLIACYEHLTGLVGRERLDRIVVGHDMDVFTRHKSWIAGSNPVAEICVAPGHASALPSGLR